MKWDEPPTAYKGTSASEARVSGAVAMIHGLGAFTVAQLADVDPERAYEAMRRHIVGLAQVTPAGYAAILTSALEDVRADLERGEQ